MQYQKLLDTVFNSGEEDWTKTNIHAIYRWDFGTNKGQPFLNPVEHYNTAVYRGDANITITFAARIETWNEDWTREFHDAGASKVAVQIRYAGVPVFEDYFVTVDGLRYLMPIPQRDAAGGFSLDQDELPFAQLMFDLWQSGSQGYSFAEALGRAKVKVQHQA